MDHRSPRLPDTAAGDTNGSSDSPGDFGKKAESLVFSPIHSGIPACGPGGLIDRGFPDAEMSVPPDRRTRERPIYRNRVSDTIVPSRLWLAGRGSK